MEILMPGFGGQVGEAYDFYRLPDPHLPWLRINMISSVDGRATDAYGLSGGLGGEGDRAAFRALRALADAVLVGGGTARAEGYGPHRVHASVASRRLSDGRDQPAAIVVVSASLSLDVRTPLFTEAVTPPIVLTSAAAPAEARRRLEGAAQVIVAGDAQVDMTTGLAELRRRGLMQIVCEGGPTLNASLLAEGLVDELCLTVAPHVLGTAGTTIVAETGGSSRAALAVAGVAMEGDELFLRYLVRRGEGQAP